MKKSILLFFLCFITFLYAQKDSVKISITGQLSTWGNVQVESPYSVEFGGRFIPVLSGEFPLSNKSKIDFEASANVYGTANFAGLRYDTVRGGLKPYRLWGAYTSEHWEVRTGLQKINFGSAKLFRPLMWFDGVDVRDPLQLTEGVYGLLGKYFFGNKGNVWFWGLIGNNKLKGYETIVTSEWRPEIGARVQVPVGLGEIALSTDNRQVDIPSGLGHWTLNETKLGIDGKWDLAVGLWFEASITSLEVRNINSPLLQGGQDVWSVGADYNIPIGNGFKLTAEYFRYHTANQLFGEGSTFSMLGTMLTIPITSLDNLTGMLFYIPDEGKWMNYMSWARTYKHFSIYGIGYWNPSIVQLTPIQSQNKNLYAGKGFEVMASYNF